MAFNTRRNAEGVSSVGARRNPTNLANNFIPGGQVSSGNAARASVVLAPPNVQQFSRPQGIPKPQNGNFKQQQQQQQQRPQMPAQQQRQQRSQMPTQQQQQQQQPPPAMTNEAQPDTNVEQKKSFWNTAKTGKISRSERQRRRNVRLSRILQPKNAVMILNELVKSATYTVSDLPQPSHMNQYTATVLIDGVAHCGQGRSKMEAKSMAAEAALKYIVKKRQLTAFVKEENGDDKMEVGEDGTPSLPWQHMASFALYKLLNSWGEDMMQTKGESSAGPLPQNKPAKKLPENAIQMNPLMLINQMLPHAQFEEISRTGNPPNVIFICRCTVDGQAFDGTGSNKKSAKKLAAFAACKNILKIEYPPDVYTPTN